MADRGREVKKGDRYVWSKPVKTTALIEGEVLRVARDGSWADIRYTQRVAHRATSTWTKRQKLPLSDEFELVDPPAAARRPASRSDEEKRTN